MSGIRLQSTLVHSQPSGETSSRGLCPCHNGPRNRLRAKRRNTRNLRSAPARSEFAYCAPLRSIASASLSCRYSAPCSMEIGTIPLRDRKQRAGPYSTYPMALQPRWVNGGCSLERLRLTVRLIYRDFVSLPSLSIRILRVESGRVDKLDLFVHCILSVVSCAARSTQLPFAVGKVRSWRLNEGFADVSVLWYRL